MKDVTNNTLTEINVEFKPAEIKVDYEAVERQLNAVVAQYADYEVTAATYKADYEERTRLNKLKQALEARRKEINSVISEPYKEFKKWYDQTIKPLDEKAVIESAKKTGAVVVVEEPVVEEMKEYKADTTEKEEAVEAVETETTGAQEPVQEPKTVNTGDIDLAQVLMIAACSLAGAYLAVKQKAIN